MSESDPTGAPSAMGQGGGGQSEDEREEGYGQGDMGGRSGTADRTGTGGTQGGESGVRDAGAADEDSDYGGDEDEM